MRSIKHFFEQSWLLIVASFFFGLLIAVTNAALSARFTWTATAKLNTLASGLLPEAENFTPLDQTIDIVASGGKRAIDDGDAMLAEALAYAGDHGGRSCVD